MSPSRPRRTVSVATASGAPGARTAGKTTMAEYQIPDGPKMLRETLCVAQTALGIAFPNDPRLWTHLDRLGRLIDECDRHRPLGPDGKHGDRHTPTCGCEDTDRG